MGNLNPNPSPIFLLIFLCNLIFVCESLNFTFNGFNASRDELIREGAVIEENGALRLTDNSLDAMGNAFYPSPIPLMANDSFSTKFVFQINPSTLGSNGGYGLGFVISQSPRFPGGAPGHYMGVFNSFNDMNVSNHVFMVEFDTVRGYNEEFDDVGNHVGINFNGMDSVNKTAALFDGDSIFLESAKPIHARVDYDGVLKRVNVTIASLSRSEEPVKPLISEPCDLSEVFTSESVYVGFSAATGAEKSSSHYILGWSFSLNGLSDQLSSSLLPVIKPTSPSSSSSKRSINAKTGHVAALSVVLAICIVSLLGIIFYRRSRKFEALEKWELDCPHRFRYKDLHTATKGFKESEKIGVGGFGTVYRGVLPSTGGEVAVKKITTNNSFQGMREFAAEIETLGRLRHRNLVHLQGWCKNRNDLVLVYDYVPNGSLDSLLYRSNSSILTWEQRFNIIKGVASGLLYLHEDWEQVVIHRDVKSSNVLIDRDMSPRLGDFGLARLYDHGKISHTTNVVGTIGYIAPELSRTGKASTDTDVFAYGILLLEIVCGRAAVVYQAHENVILVDWVVECMQNGRIFDAVDAKLDGVYVVEEMELVLGLGLLCSHPKKEMRPTMRKVIRYLNGDEVLPLFERLSKDRSTRLEEITSRFLELGLIDRVSNTSTDYYNSSVSLNMMSSNSFDAR